MTNKRKSQSILLIVAITSFMGTFLVSAVNIALPSIEHSFSLSALQLSWIITSFILGTALFMLPAGVWGDNSDNSKLFKLGLIIFTLASAICYIAPNGTWLIAARFLQGVGTAFSGTTGQAILVSSFPPQKRGRVLGISVSAVYSGLALGPLLGGIITQHFGWRFLFIIAAVLGIFTIIISMLYLKSEKKIDRVIKKTDKLGTIIFMTGLTTLVYGSSQIPSPTGWTLMAISIVLLFLFWNIESRAQNPLLNTSLFTKKQTVHLLQLIGTNKLYSYICHCIFLKPLSAKDSKPITSRSRSCNYSTTINDGNLLASGR